MGRKESKAKERETGIAVAFQKTFDYLRGGQDEFVDYSQRSSLPMFWSGRPDSGYSIIASLSMSLLATGFGGIHFIAWSSEFPSHAELVLWRVACILLTAAPLTPWISAAASMLLECMLVVFVPAIILLPPLYIACRAATLLIAFTTLRSLPDAALVDVDWTKFIPHV
jgi:hypothetical protein